MCNQVAPDRQTCMMDGHTTKIVHKPIFGELAMHDFTHDIFSKHVSPTITHGDRILTK